VVAGLWCGQSGLHDAVLAPRLHAEPSEHGDIRLDIEPGLDGATVGQLLSMFPHHRPWPTIDMYFGGVHAAQRSADGSMLGVGDPRRSGVSIVVDA
jgi:gamma-glutamyltranspeptidase/glutathione hydrolase